MAILQKHEISDTIRIQLVDNSKAWQIRFKDDSGKWVTRSSGERDMLKAASVATNILGTVTPTFKQVMDMWITTINASTRKNKDYIANLYNYALPTLADKPIDSILQKDITTLLSIREIAFKQRNKRSPAKSTVLNWNAAINHVFNHAILQDMVHHTKIPKLNIEKQGEADSRRLHFNEKTVNQLFNSDFFTKETTNTKTKLIRSVLRPYMEFLLESGVRHGTETDNMKFSDFKKELTPSGVEYMQGIVRKGKTTKHTGNRTIVIGAMGGDAILDLQPITGENINSRLLGDGDKRITTERLQNVFKQLLVHEKVITKEDNTHENDGYSLYSFRHTYITRQLMKKRNLHLIAKQCGTSVEMLETNYSHLTATMGALELISG